MTILITTIPDDPKEWAGWLEQHLVGLSLRDLIDELRLLPGSTSTPLSSLLNEKHLSEVRISGLSALNVNQIRSLFGSPESLLELQEDILFNGGQYWSSLPTAVDLKQATERVRLTLTNAIPQDERTTLPPERQPGGRSRGKFLIAIVSTAAILLIGVFTWRMQPAGSGSVLGTPGLLASDVNSSSEYLNRIAEAGNEWFEQNPRDSDELVRLLKNVSSDCQILIDADHKLLSPAERNWFVGKCENWKREFDATLASLQSGRLTFEAARAESDKTMMKLVNVLRAGPAA